MSLISTVGPEALMSKRMGILKFGLKQVSEMLGLELRLLSYWVDSKLLPDVALNELGKGQRREFLVANLIQLVIIKELDKYAVHTRTMQRVLQSLDESGYFDRLANKDRNDEIASIYVNDSGNVELKNGKSIAIDDYKSLIQINLPRLEEDVSRAIGRVQDGRGGQASH